MARRTKAQLADLIEDMVDKSRDDTTFDNFVQDMLDLTFQEIASEVPWARWLLDEAEVTTTSDQQYVAIPSDMDIDSLVSARVEDDFTKLIRINPEDADRIDPGRDLTGREIFFWFQRVGGSDRLYFLNRPDSVDTITFIFGNAVDDPASGGNYPLPAKYESVLIHGALIKVWERLDPDHPTTKHESFYVKGLDKIKKDANREPSTSDVMVSHRPQKGTGVQGPSFPADFDVSI